MKLRVNKEQIIDGLLKAAMICPPKAGAAYLRSIWLRASEGSLSIMATDALIEFTGTYPAEVSEPGLLGVSGKSFVDLVRQLPNGLISLELDKNENVLLLTQGRRCYRLPIAGPDWFQDLSHFPEEGAVAWSGDFLQEILERVAFCISDDDSMDAIACLCLKPELSGDGDARKPSGRIDACGLNGHQFAMLSFSHYDLAARLPEKGLLLQKRYLQDIRKWLGVDEIELNLTPKRFYLRRMDGSEMLSLPRAIYDYPDYSVFLGKLKESGASLLSLGRKECMESLGRILIFNSDADRCVYIDLSADQARLSAQGDERGSGEEELAADYDGEIKRIAFPTRNLMDVLGHFVSEGAELTLTSVDGPCGIRGPEDHDYLVIIMPMKISEKSIYDD